VPCIIQNKLIRQPGSQAGVSREPISQRPEAEPELKGIKARTTIGVNDPVA